MAEARLEFSDNDLTRRYFAKFGHIIGLLHSISLQDTPAGRDPLGQIETDIIEGYLAKLAKTFTALSTKYLLTGLVRNRLPAKLEIDQVDSGFPVFREIVTLADDRTRAPKKIAHLPDRGALKSAITDHVLKHKTMPRDLQFTMSQRAYLEMLLGDDLFLARNPPVLRDMPRTAAGKARYLIDWAVYDKQRNFPNVYLMVLEETDEPPLGEDQEAWDKVTKHLLAQSLSGLKLVTIASGLDQDFRRLHPKLLKRVHIGPMYSNHFTRHSDAVQQILDETDGDPDQDWVFAWTVETVFSKQTQTTSAGLFGTALKEIYHLDVHSPEVFEAGASTLDRYMILPYRAYQALVERRDEQFNAVHKYVVGPDGMILSHA